LEKQGPWNEILGMTLPSGLRIRGKSKATYFWRGDGIKERPVARQGSNEFAIEGNRANINGKGKDDRTCRWRGTRWGDEFVERTI